jgi:TolB-like protein
MLGKLQFGVYELDRDAMELRKHGVPIRLQEQPLRVLATLVERPGEVVTREDLQERIWGKDTFVDFEQSLNKAVNRLREALNDEAGQPRYVETVPRRGYRFIAPVAGPMPIEQTLSGFHSLAVLPFTNGSGPREAEYLSEGISESIINLLSQFPGLRVVPRTSAFRYKGLEAELRRIGRELHVETVLTGSVMQRADRLIVQTELVDVANEAQLWGDQYNRRLEDIFDLQEELARRICESLRPQLAPQAEKFLTKRPTENREAYHLYLKARYFANKWNSEGIQQGMAYSRQAIELDPLFAQAYVGLAYLYILVSYFGGVSPLEVFPMARAAALKALEIDDTLATAHACLGYIQLAYDWDWAGAEKESRRAIDLAPNIPGGHHIRSQWCLVNGLSEEAIAEARATLDLDPLSLPNHQNLAITFQVLRKYDLAIGQFQKALELDPSFSAARQALAFTYACTGRYQEALEELGEPPVLSDENIRVNIAGRGIWGMINAMAGRCVEARMVLAEMIEFSKPPDYVPAFFCAAIHSLLGAKDEAFKWLDRARQGRHASLFHVKLRPEFDPLREDPRFNELLQRMGIPK